MNQEFATIALAFVTVVLAGCTSPAAEPQPAGEAGALTPASSPTSAGAPDAPKAASEVVLYLTPDRTLTVEPLAEQGVVTLDTPVNSPFTGDYPTWTGALPERLDARDAVLDVVFYVTSSTVSASPKDTPVAQAFGDDPWPAFYLNVAMGGHEVVFRADGPLTLAANQVEEVRASIPVDLGLAEAGAEVSFHATPIYIHVATAAEFQYVMGPDHLAHVALRAA